MSLEMDKRFDPSSYEGRWQKLWAEKGYFVCEAPSAKPGFCIMIPPPNVTGKLHMGHALQSTLQDVLTRWKRMQGHNALWLPGTDHAGIATQLMVERELAKEGTSREALGRERFLARMWAWKEQYQGNIRRQLDLLGASCDWTRERFTLDEGLSRAVREAFVRLHREGLITRGEYIVNWSPTLDTAISDLEVEMKPVRGKLYHIRYAVESPQAGVPEAIVVATTRPETMLGDTAVAFHPEDERYRGLAGKHAILPLLGRRLPFVADSGVDREFGTGLVKVTPSHDPFDFELAQRHGLPGIQVIDRHGRMTPEAGDSFAGLDRFAARRKVVEMLESGGDLVKIEDHEHNVGHSQRSGEPIEPLVSTQWFCDVSGMARRARLALESGALHLMPESWGKTWEHWLANIKPWCISRQLWWGHQIPAWYASDGRCFVAHSREEAQAQAGTNELVQDPDVLDTWFSSALWPFSTLGWPEETADLATFYPTDVLVTGFDILFFWVARMVMTGLHFTGKAPFRTVHLTGLVRDPEGQKMSKTKGNVVDPEHLIAEHGADAVRFTLAALDAPGRDIPLDPERIAGYRAFGNKIWNATRFVLPRTEGARIKPDLSPAGLALPERWILSRLADTERRVHEALATFRFDQACFHLYQFFWSDFCDWYIELAKVALDAGDGAEEAKSFQVKGVLLGVLDRSLRLLHPVMPFLTEELWQRLPGHETIHPETICLAPYPAALTEWRDDAAEQAIEWFQRLSNAVRNQRVERKAPPRAGCVLYLESFPPNLEDFDWRAALKVRERVRETGLLGQRVPDGLVGGRGGTPYKADFDSMPADAAPAPDGDRLSAQLAEVTAQIERAEAQLADPGFTGKAPPNVVEARRRRLEELLAQHERLSASRTPGTVVS